MSSSVSSVVLLEVLGVALDIVFQIPDNRRDHASLSRSGRSLNRNKV
jgi:hypothetical protein